MTRRLILLRHAKSSWSQQGAGDHARVLNGRGRNDCDAIGRWLAAHGYLPDEVLCSSAARTCETWDRVSAHLPQPPAMAPLDKLYLADPGTLFNSLSGATGNCVAILAHNPGIADFAHQIVATPPEHDGFSHYPTLAVTIIDFDIETWTGLKPGTGRVFDFVVPRALSMG